MFIKDNDKMGYRTINITKRRQERVKRLKTLVTRNPPLSIKQALIIYAEEVGISFYGARRDYYDVLKPTLKR